LERKGKTMGWSCRVEASEVERIWSAACVGSSGSQNVWEAGGRWYMYEISHKEHDDGAITGRISRFEGDPRGKDSNMARTAGSFRIEGNGEVSRGPALLKAAGKEFAKREAAKAAFAAGAKFVVV
jgi:hypothetical protein